jgi:hypothetical protein
MPTALRILVPIVFFSRTEVFAPRVFFLFDAGGGGGGLEDASVFATDATSSPGDGGGGCGGGTMGAWRSLVFAMGATSFSFNGGNMGGCRSGIRNDGAGFLGGVMIFGCCLFGFLLLLCLTGT